MYNRAALVARAINSILAQGIDSIEILVIDDGSTDDTPQVLAGLGPPVTIIRQKNGGPSAARNVGIARARGEFIGFLDSDDVLTPNSLVTRLQLMREHSDLVMVIGNSLIVSDGPDTTWPTQFDLARELATQPQIAITDDAFVLPRFSAWMLLDAIACTPGVLIRRSACSSDLHFDTSLRCGEDWDLWIRLGRLGPVALHSAIAYHRYFLGDNLSRDSYQDALGEATVFARYKDAIWLEPPERTLVRARWAQSQLNMAWALRQRRAKVGPIVRRYLKAFRNQPSVAMRGLAGLAVERLLHHRGAPRS